MNDKELCMLFSKRLQLVGDDSSSSVYKQVALCRSFECCQRKQDQHPHSCWDGGEAATVCATATHL